MAKKKTNAELEKELAQAQKDKETAEKNLDKALSRLSQAEGKKLAGVKTTQIKVDGKEVTFRGNGITYKGTTYSAEELKRNPKVVKELIASGCGMIIN
jgi:hypothetical protein